MLGFGRSVNTAREVSLEGNNISLAKRALREISRSLNELTPHDEKSSFLLATYRFDVQKALESIPRRGRIFDREKLAEARKRIALMGEHIAEAYEGLSSPEIAEAATKFIEATRPPIPLDAGEFLLLLKNDYIGQCQVNDPSSGAYQSHRTYGAYKISCLGDIVVNKVEDLLHFLPPEGDALQRAGREASGLGADAIGIGGHLLISLEGTSMHPLTQADINFFQRYARSFGLSVGMDLSEEQRNAWEAFQCERLLAESNLPSHRS